MAGSIYSTVSKRSRMNGQNGWGGDTASEEVETVTMLLELPRGGPHFCWSGLCVPLDFAPISTIHFPNSVSKYLQISSSPDKDRWIDDRYGRLDVLPHSLTHCSLGHPNHTLHCRIQCPVYTRSRKNLSTTFPRYTYSIFAF